MTSRGLAELRAFEQLVGPIGFIRSDQQFAQLMALIANVNRDTKQRPEPYTAEEFMPQWDMREQAERTPEEIMAAAREVNALFGGTERNA